jgi:TolA-binding protein
MALLDAESKELEEQLDTMESRLDRLRSLYEQYFQGIEKLEPSMERTAVHHQFQQMRKIRTRNTVLRFRLNQLIARMNTYETYWTRISRQIEDGTYSRDLFMARYRSRAKTDQPKEEAAGEQAASGGEEKPAPARTPDRRAGQPRAALDDRVVGAIYDAYVLAKRRCKESTKGLTKEALANSLRKQVPAIMKQHRCKSVEFKVVIKKGKAILKAVPKF